MKIAKANDEQYESVRSFYHSLIDAMKGSHYDIGWEKDIYPVPEFLKESIDGGELYICTEDDHIVGAMVLNHQCNDGYRKFQWQTEAADQKVIRLDVLAGNVPAEKLYTGLGFKYMDTLRMYYEDTGWTDYELYEYVLK